MKHQTTAFNREGEMFNVVMTSTFVQLADGRSEEIDSNRQPEITDLNRSAMFPDVRQYQKQLDSLREKHRTDENEWRGRMELDHLEHMELRTAPSCR